jgi:hypothetical protein
MDRITAVRRGNAKTANRARQGACAAVGVGPTRPVLLLISFSAARKENQILREVYPERSEWAQDDMSF